MKTIELFSGTKSFSKVADSLGYSTFTIDNDSRLNPDYCVSVLELQNIGKYDIMWASPPCQSFSVASIYRHWKDGKPKSESAILGLKLLDHTIKLIAENRPKIWYIENPRGMMRKKIDKIFERYGLKDYRRVTISYCQYGDKRMKPTDIWTNDFNWIPRKLCKPGSSCHEEAKRGSKGGTQGLSNSKERGVIPKELFYEILGKRIEKQEVLKC